MDIVFLVLMFLGASLVLVFAVNEKNNKESMDINKVINKIPVIVKEIEEMHCKMTDAELLSQKLTKEDIKKVREFCNIPTAEKEKNFKRKVQ